MNILQWAVVACTVLGFSGADPISAQCGKGTAPSGFIQRGIEIAPNSWPWLAALVYTENGKFFCGATLISLKAALTAAHCIQPKHTKTRLTPSDVEVHLGRHDLSDVEELDNVAKKLEPLTTIAMHPDWKPTDYTNFRYDADIALLIAAKEIERSPSISPICLPDQDTQNVNGIIVGWGFSNDEKRTSEDIPKQADMEKVSLIDCLFEDNDLAAIASKRTYCVKGIAEGAGPCKGDSGGGFFIKLGDSWFIDGIVSSGLVGPSSQCPKTKHSIFTKLISFTNWIEQETSQQQYEVPFTYTFENNTDSFGPHYELEISEVLRRGAVLSTMGHSVHYEVEKLWCSHQNWGFLPNNIGNLFPNLKELRPSNLKIETIERLQFRNMERLEVLEMSNNLIKQIPSDCFEDLKNLVEIRLGYNKLRTIHADTFIHNPSVRMIELTYNQIQATVLKNLNNSNVKELWLNVNQLNSIPFDSFNGMPNLKEIYLRKNKLTAIRANTFINNPSLLVIDLQSNRFKPSELKNLKNPNVETLWLNENKLESLPFDAFDGMPNLKMIGLQDNKLTSLHKDTFLKNPHLTELQVLNNQIQSLPEGLFRKNKNLNRFFSSNNEINEINIIFWNFGDYDLTDNICINENYSPGDSVDLETMNQDILLKCGTK